MVESNPTKLDRERAGALSPYMGVITLLYFAAAIFFRCIRHLAWQRCPCYYRYAECAELPCAHTIRPLREKRGQQLSRDVSLLASPTLAVP